MGYSGKKGYEALSFLCGWRLDKGSFGLDYGHGHERIEDQSSYLVLLWGWLLGLMKSYQIAFFKRQVFIKLDAFDRTERKYILSF